MNGPSFAQRAFTESRLSERGDVPASDQMEDVEKLYGIAVSMVGSDAELLSLTHRLAVYTDMDINYRGDLLHWSKLFSEASTAYSHEYMEILSMMSGE